MVDLDEMAPLKEIFIDESSQTGHRYLCLGALVLPIAAREEMDRVVAEARLPELPLGELAWSKVSRSKLVAYERVVEAIFSKLRKGTAEFHSITIDTYKVNNAYYNGGSREIGFNKELYQLCIKAGRFNLSCRFHTYLDNRTTSKGTEELRKILNAGIRIKGHRLRDPFHRVHFRESANTPCIQVVDLLLGALAFQLNGHASKNGAAPHKCQLSQQVLNLARIRDPFIDTQVTGAFTLWHRQLASTRGS